MSSYRPLQVPSPSSSVPPEVVKNTNGTEKETNLPPCVPPVLPPCPVTAEEFIQPQTQTQSNLVQHCDDYAVDSVEHNNEVAAHPQKNARINARSIAFQHEHDDESSVTAFFNCFPDGYIFRPHNWELIKHYLEKKISRRQLAKNRIHSVELYKHNPDELAGKYSSYGENDWYFFTPRDRKYRNGTRPSRSAGTGYWKATGVDKEIYDKENQLVGCTRSLVFYVGKAPNGEKTDWIMQEYRVANNHSHTPPPAHREPGDMKLDDWVLCKLYKNTRSRTSSVRNRNTQAELLTTQVTGDDGDDGDDGNDGDDDDNEEYDCSEDDYTLNNLDSLEPVMAYESNLEMIDTGLVNPCFQNETNLYNLAPLPVALQISNFARGETFNSLLPFCDNNNPLVLNPINNGQQSHPSPLIMFNLINISQQSHPSPQPPLTGFHPIDNSQKSHPSPQPNTCQLPLTGSHPIDNSQQMTHPSSQPTTEDSLFDENLFGSSM